MDILGCSDNIHLVEELNMNLCLNVSEISVKMDVAGREGQQTLLRYCWADLTSCVRQQLDQNDLKLHEGKLL